jgi:hypothetical protein
MYILKNRNIFYKNKQINYKKGIPTGLPSSNIVFTLIMDEIIYRWRSMTKGLFEIGRDFRINIYVDDIYIKVYDMSIKDVLVSTLIEILKNNKFNVNFEKCKADAKLKLKFFTNLEETDMYLGIPFTRDIKKYTDLVLNKYNKNETYETIYEKLKNEHTDKKEIYGYFNYKLKPIMNCMELIDFIEKLVNKR